MLSNMWIYRYFNLNMYSVLLQSCVKVAADFVSPENIHECTRLAQEFRRLPEDHFAKEDKLEVMSAVHFICLFFEKSSSYSRNYAVVSLLTELIITSENHFCWSYRASPPLSFLFKP